VRPASFSPRCPWDACGVWVRKPRPRWQTLGFRTVGQIAASDLDWLDKRISGGRDLWNWRVVSTRAQLFPTVKQRARRRGHVRRGPGWHGRAATPCALAGSGAWDVVCAGGQKNNGGAAQAKLADFTLLTRQTTLHEPTDDGQAIYRAASALLLAEKLESESQAHRRSAQRLLSQGGQLPLFDSDRRTGRLNAALDSIHDKFGSAALTTATCTRLQPKSGNR